jgi:cathepsin L
MSAQELVNCVPNPQECGGNGGCQGATVELAMYHMMQKGLNSEADEPYLGNDGECHNPSAAVSLVQNVGKGSDNQSLSLTVEQLTTPGRIQVALPFAQESIGLLQWYRLPANEDGPLQEALLQGTVAVSVAGSAWAGYGHGIFDNCNADAVIDHAVVAIGFGKEGDNKYWTIRNSWGQHWGENGKIRLLRTDTPVCGTDHQPEVGTGCIGGPSSVEVCGTCGVLYDSVYAEFR